MTAEHDIVFKPNTVQRQFIESQAQADLFSSRMGEGKTAGLVWSSFYHVRHNPGASHVFIRDTWENIRSTTLKEFFKWFPPGVAGTWHEQKKTFTWAEGVAKGSVEFIGMDDPSDASKLQSRELAAFYVDEPAPAAQSGGISELVFDIALSRLRQPGIKWYSAKLATNNPDETHWTYRRFVDPGTEGFATWQPSAPENERNLPPEYYSTLRRVWAHRPALVERFVEGKYGFIHEGRIVTPQWSDQLHLAVGLIPVKGTKLDLLWDFGLNPTCIITQTTPQGYWLILDSMVGDEIGVAELIQNEVRPLLVSKYKGYSWRHIGDPAGNTREQSSSARTAVRLLLRELGGTFRAGPKGLERLEPLRSILTKTISGRGLVQVDRRCAPHVWQALRGGWHYHVSRTGVISTDPVKDIHSHPGDAMSYGASVIWPLGRLLQSRGGNKPPVHATFFSSAKPFAPIPPEGRIIGS